VLCMLRRIGYILFIKLPDRLISPLAITMPLEGRKAIVSPIKQLVISETS
jgi:hypothetical protein